MFQYSKKDLSSIIDFIEDYLKNKKIDSYELDIFESDGQSVGVRLGELEKIDYEKDQSLEFTVFTGHKTGSASTSDFSHSSLIEVMDSAINISKYTSEDQYSGLADLKSMYQGNEDLALYYPWDISVDDSIKMALSLEYEALNFDRRIKNSEGASISSGHTQFLYANSHGFRGFNQSSKHFISCSVIAENQNEMQREYAYRVFRDPKYLPNLKELGVEASQKSIDRLNSRKILTGQYPVIFDVNVSSSLIGHIVKALSGSSLYRKISFLQNSKGMKKCSKLVNLREEPHILGGFASTYFDGDGVATYARDIIVDGVIEDYFLSAYSARKLGLISTANAGSVQNLILKPTVNSQVDLLSMMDKGLLITDLMGSSINLFTGDYSRGASGFWVENGEIQYPVEEITIASNLTEMMQSIIAIASDYLPYKTHKIGSILVENMMVAN